MDPVWPKLSTTVNREHGKYRLDVDFLSITCLCETTSNWIEIKLHFIAFTNQQYCKGDGFFWKNSDIFPMQSIVTLLPSEPTTGYMVWQASVCFGSWWDKIFEIRFGFQGCHSYWLLRTPASHTCLESYTFNLWDSLSLFIRMLVLR